MEKEGDNSYCNINIKDKLPLIVGFLLTFLLFVFYNLTYYQKPIAFTNTYTIKFLETSGIDFKDIKLTNNIFSDRQYESRFSLEQAPSGVQTLLISKDRGLLQFSPVYLLAIYGGFILYKKRKLLTLSMFMAFLLNLIIYGSYDDPWGGWAFGPRYLIVTLPILAIFNGAAYERLVHRFKIKAKIVILLLLAVSSVIALLGALTTNAVPPSVEVVKTNIPSNYISNWNYLNNTGVSSFFYTLIPQGLISPIIYFIILFLLLLYIEFKIIFDTKPRN